MRELHTGTCSLRRRHVLQFPRGAVDRSVRAFGAQRWSTDRQLGRALILGSLRRHDDQHGE
jgi:hypothetical protein